MYKRNFNCSKLIFFLNSDFYSNSRSKSIIFFKTKNLYYIVRIEFPFDYPNRVDTNVAAFDRAPIVEPRDRL